MLSTIVRNIGELVTNSDSDLGIIKNASLVIEDGKVVWVGDNSKAPSCDQKIDANFGTVTPGFVDSHTHLVFAGDRSTEFEKRMRGEKYEAGGINITVDATRKATLEELTFLTRRRVTRAQKMGTTTIEIKSGYGLDVDNEVKLLKVAKQFTDETTFLGAHVVPMGFNRRDYIDLVKGQMLDKCAPYAKWIDVFCDTGAFEVSEAREILQAGINKGLKGRIHGNQLGHTGGAKLAAEMKLASIDHGTYLSDEDIEHLAASEVTVTLLPATEFFTNSPYPDGKRLLDSGLQIALASNCNPGSSYLSSMSINMSIAVREMKMTPAQALYAATKGGAQALQLEDVGHLQISATANLIIWDAPSYQHITYRFGEIESKTIKGKDL